MREIAYWLSLGLVFAIPFQNVVDLPGLGTIARGIGLLVMAFWVLTVAASGTIRRPTAFHGAALLFVLWFLLSSLWSIDVGRTLERSETYLQLLALTYIVWDLYTTPPRIRGCFQAYVLGCWVAIYSLLGNYQAGITEVSKRYSATGFNSNTLAMGLALGLPLAWYLVLTPAGRGLGTRLLRLVNLAYLPLALYAILLTASRAGFFGALPLLGLMALSLPRFRLQGAALAVVLALAAAGVVYSAAPRTSIERLAGTGEEMRSGDWNQRAAIWRESLRSVALHPIAGAGGGTHKSVAIETRKSAHNFALALLVEVGTVGFLLFLAALGAAALEIRVLSRWDRWFWLTMFGIWLLNNLTHSFHDSKQTWLFLALAVAIAGVVRQREESPIPGVGAPIAGAPVAASANTDS